MTTKEQIIELLKGTKRVGIKSLIEYLLSSDFFTASASTRFHGSYEGGLAKHSLAVYDMLWEFHMKLTGIDVSPGQKPLECKPENVIIAVLLHDVCKIGAYIPTPNGKNPYKWNRQQPKGHAKLSIERIKKHIKLEPIEEMVITYHMGVYGLNGFYGEDDWQTGEYPLRGTKDESMTKEESQKARYGKSLANAWYHNTICKIMYLCDELATLEEKAE